MLLFTKNVCLYGSMIFSKCRGQILMVLYQIFVGGKSGKWKNSLTLGWI